MKITTESIAQELVGQMLFLAGVEDAPDMGPSAELVNVIPKDQAFGQGIVLTYADGSQYLVTVRLMREAEV